TVKNKIILVAIISILSTLIYTFSVSSQEMVVEDVSEEVEYDFKTCGLCHAVPEIAKRELGVEEKNRCDGCHGQNNKVIVVASADDPTIKGTKKKKAWVFAGEKKPEGLGTMIYIPAGDFIQGTNIRHADEGPEHTTYVDGYYIGKYETTNQEYKEFIDATGHKRPTHWVTGTYRKGLKYHPVVYVNMFDAQAFCEWRGHRLPHESEWEKAARGTEGFIHPWGNDFDPNKGNVVALGLKHTTPVGSFKEGASPYGLHDMVGNVWEWTDTWFYPYKDRVIPDKDEYYAKKVLTLKGGSWFNCHAYNCGMSAYTFNRSQFSPTVKNNSFGFRCVQEDDGKRAK
ncbi:MAG: SUMF1/EgtB/PvdO family nonheme iron enzyme, partial [Thermodesulfobacteriota bacterium]